MHASITFIISILLLSISLQAQTNKLVSEVAEHAFGPIAKEAADKTAKEIVEKLAVSVGKQVAESTEAQLARAIATNGAEVGMLALRVPEATEVLARNAKSLVPLAERFGDDILRIEARAPGFAEIAAKSYDKKYLPRLLNLSESEMKGVLAVAKHTTEPQAAKLLLEGTEKGGMSFLEKISGPQILATGLSAATIIGIMGIEDKIPPGPETARMFFDVVGKLLSPITAVAACLLTAWGALAIWRRHKRANT
jgi:hypothetical protein